MNEPRIQIGGIDTPSPFETAPSVLKQPFRLSEIPILADPFGGFEEPRIVDVGTSETLLGEDPRPFQVVPDGNNTVEVKTGKILWFNPQDTGSIPNAPFSGQALSYAGETGVAVASSGTLYLVISCSGTYLYTAADSSPSPSTLETQHHQPTSAAAEMGPTLSGDQYSLPLAELTVDGVKVTVDEQILDYNPLLQLNWARIDN